MHTSHKLFCKFTCRCAQYVERYSLDNSTAALSSNATAILLQVLLHGYSALQRVQQTVHAVGPEGTERTTGS
jgi:hypothetical protein